jgi:hypothetical protein
MYPSTPAQDLHEWPLGLRLLSVTEEFQRSLLVPNPYPVHESSSPFFLAVVPTPHPGRRGLVFHRAASTRSPCSRFLERNGLLNDVFLDIVNRWWWKCLPSRPDEPFDCLGTIRFWSCGAGGPTPAHTPSPRISRTEPFGRAPWNWHLATL